MKDKTNGATVNHDVGVSAYIGPNLSGVIQTGTIFPCSKAAALEREDIKLALAKKPGIAELIVSGDELPAARIKVKTQGDALHEKYRALLSK